MPDSLLKVFSPSTLHLLYLFALSSSPRACFLCTGVCVCVCSFCSRLIQLHDKHHSPTETTQYRILLLLVAVVNCVAL